MKRILSIALACAYAFALGYTSVPAQAFTTDNIVTYSDTTGGRIHDSGVAISSLARFGNLYKSSAKCDGVNDDGAAINADFAAAPNGSTVVLSASAASQDVCLITTPIVHPINKAVNFNGGGATLKHNGNAYVYSIGDLSTGAPNPRVWIGNFHIVCGNEGTNTAIGIESRNNNATFILENVSVVSCYGGIYSHNTTIGGFAYYSEQNVLRSVDFDRCQRCIWFDSDSGTGDFANWHFDGVWVNGERGGWVGATYGFLCTGSSVPGWPSLYRSTWNSVMLYTDTQGAVGMLPNCDFSGTSGNIQFESSVTATSPNNTIAIDFANASHFSAGGVHLFSHCAGCTGGMGAGANHNLPYSGVMPDGWEMSCNFDAAYPDVECHVPHSRRVVPLTTGSGSTFAIDTSGGAIFPLTSSGDFTITNINETLAYNHCTPGKEITLYMRAAHTVTLQSINSVFTGGASNVTFAQDHGVKMTCHEDGKWYYSGAM